MNRNLKALGAALLAVFATAAVLASGAQGQTLKVTVNPSPAWLTAEVISHPEIGKVETLKLAGGQTLSCEETSSVATVKNGDTSITVVPTFKKCTAVIGTESHLVTVTMNDCDFLLHDMTTETPNSTTFTALVDLVCPVGKQVEIHIYKSATGETEELCTYKIASFTNKGGNVIHNVAGEHNDLTITHTLTEIPTTRTGSLLCGGASSNLTFTGSTTIKAFEDKGGFISEGTVFGLEEGAQTSVTISD